MTPSPLDGPDGISAYLTRIGFTGIPETTGEVLAALQERHLLTVPYENFDILAGIPLSLEVPDLFDKIVARHRGGYCFELNALFGALLRGLGFTVIDLVARFWRDETNLPPTRRHRVLRVSLGSRAFLVDVGVASVVPRWPLELKAGVEVAQGDETYRLVTDPLFGWFLEEKKRGVWQRIYSFTEEPQFPCDFLFANHWCQFAPDSKFQKGAIAGLRTAGGRHSLAGDEFRSFTKDTVTTECPWTPALYRKALATYFDIRLPVDFPWEKVRV